MQKYIAIVCANQSENRAVQELLFNNGFLWPFGRKDILHPNANVLIVSKDMLILGVATNWILEKDQIESFIHARYLNSSNIKDYIPYVRPLIPVRKMTMEELNKISRETLGYEIEITE